MSEPRRIQVYREISDEEHTAYLAEENEREVRRRGRRGLKLYGLSRHADTEWWAIIDALVDHGAIEEADRHQARISEKVKDFACPYCGSDSGYMLRGRYCKYSDGRVITCGRRCKMGDVLVELGVRVVDNPWDLTSVPGTLPRNEERRETGPERQDDQGNEQRSPYPFKVIDWKELWQQEPGEKWILQPLVSTGRGVAIWSKPKVGKSLLMLEIAVGISTGERTLGVVPDRAHRVLYVDHENDPRGDIRTRLEDMAYGPGDLENLKYLSFPAMDPLDTPLGAAQILDAAEHYDCDVVVVDTVSRAVGGKENENDTWLALYRLTGVALKKAGIAFIRLDHPGKDEEKGMRGASAKYGDVDAVWKLTKEAATTYKLTCTDKRFQIAETELVLTRQANPLRHKVEGGGWAVAADARYNDLFEQLSRLGVAQNVGRVTAAKVLRADGVQVRDRDLEKVIRHRKSCANWAGAGVDHTRCIDLFGAAWRSDDES
ncbi:AAA family ATPase [Kribbella sp. NPDC004536]|uniref:AAA family ATPase n=1 Tax=Kribbella sp. NPDC004536 TaxID=3364106 RepID=UPI00367CF3D0